jgi:hypothetical protein
MNKGYCDAPTKEHLLTRVQYLIKNPQIKEFVIKALSQAPDYIWEIQASTSGKHHHGETQTQHVLQALKVGESFCRILESVQLRDEVEPNIINPRAGDVLMAAIALHDLYKCGLPGRENKDDNGNFRTDPLHPIYPGQVLKTLAMWDEKTNTLVAAQECDWWPMFVQCVSFHSGPWSPLPPDYLLNFTSLPMLTFLADYVACQGI